MSDPRNPEGGQYENPPNWTDPYADLNDLTGDEPLPRLEHPATPPAAPPRSPLLTGLIIGLLLVALSVAVFQLLRPDETGETAGTSTTAEGTESTATSEPGSAPSSSSTTSTSTPEAAEYPPIDPPIDVDKLKLITDGIRIKSNEIDDLVFGTTPAAEAIGRFTASFGNPDSDTGWQTSTGQWGVPIGDFERIIVYGPFAAILTTQNNEDVFSGYRQDITYGGVGSVDAPAADLETLSGLKVPTTIEDLEAIYASQKVDYREDPVLDTVFELRSAKTAELLLWGPVQGQDPQDGVIGIYAPDVEDRG